MGQLTEAQKKQAAQNAAVRKAMTPAPAPKPVIAAPPKKSLLDVFRPVKTMKEASTTVKKASK